MMVHTFFCQFLLQRKMKSTLVHKLLVQDHCSESGLHSLPSRSSRCPRFTLTKTEQFHKMMIFLHKIASFFYPGSKVLQIKSPLRYRSWLQMLGTDISLETGPIRFKIFHKRMFENSIICKGSTD